MQAQLACEEAHLAAAIHAQRTRKVGVRWPKPTQAKAAAE
jgi:hypothetical protein